MIFLKVKPPEYPFARTGLIILNKIHIQSGGVKILLGITFKKITPAVFKNLRKNFKESFDKDPVVCETLFKGERHQVFSAIQER
jgi:hypothetical protein